MSPTADQPVIEEMPPPPPSPSPTAAGSVAVISWPMMWVLVASLTAVGASAMVFTAHGTRGFFVPLLASAVCVLAAVFDAWTGRIPNPLTYTAMVAGLALNGCVPLMHAMHLEMVVTWLGGPGVEMSVMGFGACAVLGVIGAVVGAGVHGGDLKLLAALGALVGLVEIGNILIVALTVAVIYSVVNLLLLGRLNRVLRIAAHRMMEMVYLKRVHTPLPEDAKVADVTHIPMAVPLAIGVIAAQWWQWRGGGA